MNSQKKTETKATPQFSLALEVLRAAAADRDATFAESNRLYDEWAKAKDRLVVAEGAFRDAREALFTEAVKDGAS